MAQGGASGSPIFNSVTGEVLGALYAGVFDFVLEEGDKPRSELDPIGGTTGAWI